MWVGGMRVHAAWKAVWALTDAKGERGVGVKKGKAQHHAHHLKTGRYCSHLELS